MRYLIATVFLMMGCTDKGTPLCDILATCNALTSQQQQVKCAQDEALAKTHGKAECAEQMYRAATCHCWYTVDQLALCTNDECRTKYSLSNNCSSWTRHPRELCFPDQLDQGAGSD